MTGKQKEAIMLLNSIKATPTVSGEAIMTDEQYFTLLEFIIEDKQVTYVPQPTIPIVTPQPLQPYYGTGTGEPNPLTPPYRVTCEFVKD